MAPETDEKINRLLHDAEHALSGAGMAMMMHDTQAAVSLKAKAARLLAEAEALDPAHESEWWEESDFGPAKEAV